MLDIFEHMRRSNIDFYTQNPLKRLSEADLIKLAKETGMTLEEMGEHINTPHVEMTCPLCGQPSTHIVLCRRCGGDAWEGEFVMVYGEDVHDKLRKQYQAALTDTHHLAEMQKRDATAPTFTLKQVTHASRHAYAWGGCCTGCWHHTLPSQAYQSCPIKLLGDQTLEPGRFPFELMTILLEDCYTIDFYRKFHQVNISIVYIRLGPGL